MERAYRRMVKPEDYLTDEESVLAYSYDASGLEATPKLVLRPRNEEQLRRILLHANQYRHKVVPRGAGTGIRGGAIREEGVILDMHAFDSLSRLDKQRGTIDVGAGVTIKELDRALAKHGFFFPLEAGVHEATIGGLASINQVMASSFRYGDYLELVEQVECFDGLGRFHTLKGKEVERVLGLEGTTGIITKLRVKVTEERIQSIDLIPVDSAADAVGAVARLNSESVAFLEYADGFCSDVLGLEKKAHIIVGYVDTTGEMQDDARLNELIERRRRIQRSLWREGFLFTEEVTVDEERLKSFLEYCERKSLPCYGHIGTGVMITHLRESASRTKFWADVVAMGATPAGKYGYGRLKKQFVPSDLRSRVVKLKEKRDYKETLNAGVLV